MKVKEKRLEKVLARVIHSELIGFMKGRYFDQIKICE